MDFPEKIQHQRKRLGLSQESLAQQLGVSRQSVSKWEAGQSQPELSKVVALSELFDVTIDYLLKDHIDIEKSEKPIPKEQVEQLLADQIPAVPFWTGIILSIVGGLGVVVLWVLSILNPPYTLGKRLNFLKAFRFYLQYNEIEPIFWLFLIPFVVGIAMVIIVKLKHTLK